MNAPDDQDVIQWQDSLRLLNRAAEDIRAARALLRDDMQTPVALAEEARAITGRL